MLGLLKIIKGSWACLPFSHRFYLPLKAINSKFDNMNIAGKIPSFKTKLEQLTDMIIKKGKPPALPERLPKFDNYGNVYKSPMM